MATNAKASRKPARPKKAPAKPSRNGHPAPPPWLRGVQARLRDVIVFLRAVENNSYEGQLHSDCERCPEVFVFAQVASRNLRSVLRRLRKVAE